MRCPHRIAIASGDAPLGGQTEIRGPSGLEALQEQVECCDDFVTTTRKVDDLALEFAQRDRRRVLRHHDVFDTFKREQRVERLCGFGSLAKRHQRQNQSGVEVGHKVGLYVDQVAFVARVLIDAKSCHSEHPVTGEG